MYQLVYVSTAVREFGGEELRELLDEARRNNSKEDVTGMLLYHGGSFFQVLEGDREAVERIYGRVAQDSRHQAVTTLHEEEADERAFGDWSMAWLELNDSTLREVPGFSDLMNRRDPHKAFSGDGRTVHNMVLTFREYAR